MTPGTGTQGREKRRGNGRRAQYNSLRQYFQGGDRARLEKIDESLDNGKRGLRSESRQLLEWNTIRIFKECKQGHDRLKVKEGPPFFIGSRNGWTRVLKEQFLTGIQRKASLGISGEKGKRVETTDAWGVVGLVAVRGTTCERGRRGEEKPSIVEGEKL